MDGVNLSLELSACNVPLFPARFLMELVMLWDYISYSLFNITVQEIMELLNISKRFPLVEACL